ncbi:MAG: acetyl-CoA carboxylase biotin carboxylase subunit [Verrucomicrobia bacterium]|jgi:acetyl-CoA carboxylase biotin carboxylase subunit|nr:acetyl-CoA carboxylase biotin carboxylase subunit [Verrucomicrobiota bacterium]OQC66057.1 MAG: Biotin carboxylase [Verrucomicrobia bacterium ADurb.Bin006]MDI9380966.1 acetyl-CoA carboxylase biotin carboxylase subunit [Verrucomicrobiota bacterium]HOA62218.1 acetyl-CoA carboxylase biotin carboxylase subunit [Verrucomicrobiota bacterium]HOF49520.1 acetyl-CoA carboxylase biotin carboxylase subunit [Verrucomicrobiota bacterium]
MFEKILVANRGEIAVRIIRTCKELGIRTVAVYSEADVNSMHVQMADEAICIGPACSSESYMRIDRLISAAEITDVDAIHPGYGFLSEDAHFADVCESCNIRFIGPNSRAMNALQDKATSRELAKKAGIPVPPGSDGVVETETDALATAKKIGYPVLLKAVAGGGGRGMRIAHNDISLMKGYHTARSEAEKAFGNSGVYIEKYFENPHHIEFQILGDGRGNIIHLGERDCSIQRRHQKLVEETPSPLIDHKHKDLRRKMGKAACRIGELSQYNNAGTVEFIVDDQGAFYFLEVNKRIQVEHPITEEVTGVDLIRMQILIAMGEQLKMSQSDVHPRGHAIQCRINAENPYDDFRPSPGRIEMYYAPGGHGVRVDSHVYAGYVIPPTYDSMIGKLIAYGKDRREAIDRMSRALNEYLITGVKTTIPLDQNIMLDPDFRRGVYSTGFIEQLLRRGNQ